MNSQLFPQQSGSIGPFETTSSQQSGNIGPFQQLGCKEPETGKKRVMAMPLPVSCPAKDYRDGAILHKVITKIVADDPMFIPQYQTEGSACVDLVANIPSGTIRLTHRSTVTVDCGFSMQLKPGWKANISARSDWASRGLHVLGNMNESGRCQVVVTNVGNVNPITLSNGEKLAQMSIDPVYVFDWEIVSSLCN